jgi:polysaccharide export outer membrane protein
MRCLAIFFFGIAIASSGWAQQQPNPSQASVGASAPADSSASAVPTVGKGDVISVSVYEAPELTRNVSVDADGNIRLPMVRRHIHVDGLIPDEIEKAIATALVDEQLLMNPIVSVSVVESHGRSITVVGAVRNPITFQAAGSVTLLEAIIRAGGISDAAGSEIFVTHAAPGNGTSVGLTERIAVHSLMDTSDPASSLLLEGGDTIRVPAGGQVWVVGNVQHPGPVHVADPADSTVLKAVTLAGGLQSFSKGKAYIYRTEAETGRKVEIPIDIKKIMSLKSPDVPLNGNDMLYVPSATGQRVSAKALALTFGIGLAISGLLIYLTQ